MSAVELTAQESERLMSWLCNWLDSRALQAVTTDDIKRATDRMVATIVADRSASH